MRWIEQIRYISSINHNNKTYKLLCEKDFDDTYALTINGDYTTNFKELPTKEDVIEQISQIDEMEEASHGLFHRSI